MLRSSAASSSRRTTSPSPWRSLRRLYQTPGGHARYWDEAALAADIEDFTVYVRRCTEEDVQELDTLSELEALRRCLEGKG